MTKDITERELLKMIERLEGRANRDRFDDSAPDPAPGPPEGTSSPSNSGGTDDEDTPPSPSEHATAILASLSTYQVAQLIAIQRDFDDTEPDQPDTSGGVNTEPYLAIGAYSEGRTDAPVPGDLLSEANQARLDVLTGGGEWIEVTPEDIAPARRLQNGE